MLKHSTGVFSSGAPKDSSSSDSSPTEFRTSESFMAASNDDSPRHTRLVNTRSPAISPARIMVQRILTTGINKFIVHALSGYEVEREANYTLTSEYLESAPPAESIRTVEKSIVENSEHTTVSAEILSTGLEQSKTTASVRGMFASESFQALIKDGSTLQTREDSVRSSPAPAMVQDILITGINNFITNALPAYEAKSEATDSSSTNNIPQLPQSTSASSTSSDAIDVITPTPQSYQRDDTSVSNGDLYPPFSAPPHSIDLPSFSTDSPDTATPPHSTGVASASYDDAWLIQSSQAPAMVKGIIATGMDNFTAHASPEYEKKLSDFSDVTDVMTHTPHVASHSSMSDGSSDCTDIVPHSPSSVVLAPASLDIADVQSNPPHSIELPVSTSHDTDAINHTPLPAGVLLASYDGADSTSLRPIQGPRAPAMVKSILTTGISNFMAHTLPGYIGQSESSSDSSDATHLGTQSSRPGSSSDRTSLFLHHPLSSLSPDSFAIVSHSPHSVGSPASLISHGTDTVASTTHSTILLAASSESTPP